MPYIDIDSKHTYGFQNETQLQEAVVNYLETTDLNYCATLGGTLDTVQRRIDAKRIGYVNGIQDIIVYNPCNEYNMLCIELKNPWGNSTISKAQLDCASKMEKDCKALVVISNDYTTIIEVIIKWIHNLM